MKSGLVAALMFVCPVAFGASMKIGLVDMQKAIEATKDGQNAKKELENDFGKRKKELEKKEADIRKMGEDFEKKALVLSEDVKKKKQQELQTEMAKFQQEVQKNQMDIQKRQNELLQPILVKLRKVIAGIAQKDSFTTVLEKSDQIVLYSSGDMDITDRVVKEFDSAAK